jgi:hypothetical protein
MSQFLKLEITDQQINALFADLPNVAKKATANTLNKVVRIVNKNVRKFITDNYNIPKKSIKIAGGLVSFKRADARKNRGTATIFIKKEGRGLFKYGAVQGETGVTVTIKTAPKVLRSAFIAPWRKGSNQKFVFRSDESFGMVARRTKSGKTYQSQKRKVLHGPKIADLYVSQRAGRVLDDTIGKEYQPLLDEEFNRQFEKRR